MSDAVQIEWIIAGATAFNAALGAGLRYMSHREHRETARVVANIEVNVNGKMSELIQALKEKEH